MSERPFTDTSYNQFLSERRFMASKCKECGALWSPPRSLCIKCYSSEMEWVELKGKGRLLAYTVIGVGPLPMLNAGYNRDNPYCSGIVELEEGPKIAAQILGVDVDNPESIKIGAPVTVDFIERSSWSLVSQEIADTKRTFVTFKV